MVLFNRLAKMRIWSLHPKYLDSKGLIALWRETLLAKNVLEGKTKGYKNHPQLIRFKLTKNPLTSINCYLESIWEESKNRNYNFNESKFEKTKDVEKITATRGQLNFELAHLLKKLKLRDAELYNKVILINDIETHPLFEIIEGEIESWEKT